MASQVIIANQAVFQTKLEALISGGFDNLQVIADFDRTLTRFRVNGEHGDSCHGILNRTAGLSDEYRKYTRGLYEKYYPIETCHELSVAEKIPKMIEWYEAAHDAVLKEPLHRGDIEGAVKQSNVTLREGASALLEIVQAEGVPLLIFSAGLANIIEEVLIQKHGEIKESTHIISNWIIYDEHGNLERFSEPLIHMFNKDETHVSGHEYEDTVKNRGNALLLGDGLGDVHMSNGLPDSANILKVGFLNSKVAELLPQYKGVYDVIITNDGSFDFVLNSILRKIPRQPTPN